MNDAGNSGPTLVLVIATIVLALAVGYLTRSFGEQKIQPQHHHPQATAAGTADNDASEEQHTDPWEVIGCKTAQRSIATQSQCTYMTKGQYNQPLSRARFVYLSEWQQGAWPDRTERSERD